MTSVCLAKVSILPLTTFIHNLEDCEALRSNYAILLVCELVKSLQFFKTFGDCVPTHIRHEYSDEASRKSVVVGNFGRDNVHNDAFRDMVIDNYTCG